MTSQDSRSLTCRRFPLGEVCNFVATKPLKTLSAGPWAYFNEDKFETGLLAVIHEGGDADTNASLARSLLGAKSGFNAIPVKYVNGLNKSDLLKEKYYRFIWNLEEKLKQYRVGKGS